MTAWKDRLKFRLPHIVLLAGPLALSACVVHERDYYDDGGYRYQHRQHGLYNDYEYRNSYGYGDNGYRYEGQQRVYYYDDDGYDYDEDGYGNRHRD
jgi:hypothetical protein